MSNSRREFLQSSVALAMGLAGGVTASMAEDPAKAIKAQNAPAAAQGTAPQSTGPQKPDAEIQIPKMKFGNVEIGRLVLGVNPLYAALPSYVIIMGGGAVVNMSYCFIRLAFLKRLSVRADFGQPRPTVIRNAVLAATAGIMWYLQFFFYAWGAANIPQRLFYVNWMLHMSIYVLCGGLVGLALGEWKGVGSRPVRLLWAGVLVIIAAANLVGLGMAAS